MAGAEPLGHQHRDALAEQVLPRIAEQLLGVAVHAHDVALAVHQQQRGGCGLEDLVLDLRALGQRRQRVASLLQLRAGRVERGARGAQLVAHGAELDTVGLERGVLGISCWCVHGGPEPQTNTSRRGREAGVGLQAAREARGDQQ